MNSSGAPGDTDRTTSFWHTILPPMIARLTLREQLMSLLLLLSLFSFYSWDYGQLTVEYLEQTSQRALAMFAIARGLNAAISVIQSIDLGFTLGVSATLSPGEVLDPLNDLIERFSLVMLIASVALWIIRLCGGVLFDASLLWGAVLLFASSILLTRARAIWMVSLGWLLQWGTRLFLGLLAFAVITPLLVELVHETHYVETNFQSSSSGLLQTQARLEAMSREMDASRGAATAAAREPEACVGWSECMDAIGKRWSSMSDNLTGASALADRLEAFVDETSRTATEASRQVVIQIAVFVLETLIIPLAGLWLCWRMIGWPYPSQGPDGTSARPILDRASIGRKGAF